MMASNSGQVFLPVGIQSQSVTQSKSKVTKLIHTWTIDYVSYHCDPELSLQDYLDSSMFSPYKFDQGRLQFFIRLNPLGDKENEETKDHVPVYLHMKSNKPDGVLVKVRLSIVKTSGEKCNVKGMSLNCSELNNKNANFIFYFSEDLKELFNDGKWGWPDFILRTDLLKTNKGFLTDEKLVICCEVWLLIYYF